MPLKSHVVAPVSTSSQRRTAKPAREELPIICARTGPVGTGLCAVCVECGGQTWPKKMLTYTNIRTNTRTEKVIRGTLPSHAIRYAEVFCHWKTRKKGSALRASGASLVCSRIHASKRAFSDWTCFQLHYSGPHRRSSRFYSFVLFLEAVGVREYCCLAVEIRLGALCFVRSASNACFTRATNPRPHGLVALDLALSRQSSVARDVAPRRRLYACPVLLYVVFQMCFVFVFVCSSFVPF